MCDLKFNYITQNIPVGKGQEFAEFQENLMPPHHPFWNKLVPTDNILQFSYK